VLIGRKRVWRLRAPSWAGRRRHAGAEAGGGWVTEVVGVGIQSGKGTCPRAIVGGVGGTVGGVYAQAGRLLRSNAILGKQLCPSLLVSTGSQGELEVASHSRIRPRPVGYVGRDGGGKDVHGTASYDMRHMSRGAGQRRMAVEMIAGRGTHPFCVISPS
jgi:hypothetical protein